jgi:D-3-phosphoglycerate dehydrogenase
VAETRRGAARDFTDLVRVTVASGGEQVRVVGTTLGHLHRPHLLAAWGQRFNLQIDDDHVTFFRYSDVPGMIGRVGTAFGKHGVNIVSAAVGRQSPERASDDGGFAVMAVTTAGPVPRAVIDEIVGSEGFVDGRTIAL